jgi:membrane dipeptidase
MTRRKLLMVCSLCSAFAFAASSVFAANDDAARIAHVLTATPLIDGHNDLPWEIRTRFKRDVSAFDFASDTAKLPAPEHEAALMTDIPRLHAGHVGAQFWSVWIPSQTKGADLIELTIEQIDIVKTLVARYPRDMAMAYTAADIRRVHKAGKIASLIGVEGGHQIDNSLAALREYYDLGVRYMTLTHTMNTAWADSATEAPAHHGLTAFGKEVVREMNRLGMLVDLSHVSPETMRDALDVSEAPVIFSHSSARAIVDHPRNVPDDILHRMTANGGVVMVNFYPGFISQSRNRWEGDRAAEQARIGNAPNGMYLGQPDRVASAMAQWDLAHPKPPVGISDVIDHIEHIRKIAGVDHVGLGSDFDGIPNTPDGVDGVDKFPAVLIELAHRGWSDADLAKIAGENLLRAMTQAESVSVKLRATRGASMATVDQLDKRASK